MLQHELIELTYETALNEQRWPELLRAVAGLVGGSSAFLSDRDGLDARIVHHSDPRTRHTTREYDRYWARQDPCIPGANRLRRGFVTSSRAIAPDFERTAFYNEYCKPAGRRDHLIINTFKSGDRRQQILVARRADDACFDADDSARVRFLVPHLLRASSLNGLWRATRRMLDVLEAGLDQQGWAMLILDADMRVLHGNDAAHDLLREARLLRLSGQTLIAGTSGAKRLLAMVGAALADMRVNSAAAREVLLRDERAHQHLCRVLVRRLPDASPIVTLLVARLPANQLTPEALGRVFGLTPTEAEVILAVCGGRTAEEVAAARQVRPSTVRWHVRNALEKLEVDSLRQAAWRLGAMNALLPPHY